MIIPNPYFIHIELFWPDGTRPTQNQIARVNAHDVNGATITWESQCGYDSQTGGWQPAYMQNISAFSARGRPNLRFEVTNTSEQLVHSTQVFNFIASESTVRIVIGVSDELGGDLWRVSGRVRYSDGTAVVTGTVRAYDVTAGSDALLGTALLAAGGTYTLTFASGAFSNNGSPHASPNLVVRVYDAAGMLLAESDPRFGAGHDEVVDLFAYQKPTGSYRVFGTILNALGLAVVGLTVEASHAYFAESGVDEIPLGGDTTDADGKYEIVYDPPTTAGPPGQVNLIVRAKQGAVEVAASDIVFNAGQTEALNLTAEVPGSASLSEYHRVQAALTPILGSTGNLTKLRQLDASPSQLAFAAKAAGQSEALVRAYVRAHVLAADINAIVAVPPLGRALSAEVVYALVRSGLGQTTQELIDVKPQRLFDALVEAIHGNTVSAAVETLLQATPSLLEDWAEILAALMSHDPGSSTEPAWQKALLELVFSDPVKLKAVVAAYFEHPGPFAAFAGDLVDVTITAAEAEDLVFVFALYEAVGRFLPIVDAVYAQKDAADWTTINDLAWVPLDNSTTGPSWLDLVAASDRLPPEVPGKTLEEKQRVYATRLFDFFGAMGPRNRFVAGLDAAGSSDPDLAAAVAHLSNHPDFDLESGNIDRYIEDHDLAVTTGTVAKIKQIQRTYRLTSSATAALALVALELDSAVKIAQIKEDEFVATYEEQLGGLTAAQKIHATATRYASEVLHTLVKYHSNLTATGSGIALPNGVNVSSLLGPTSCYLPDLGAPVDPTATTDTKRLPNWTTLFGDFTKCTCKECQTILSPGAYLVDLLEFVEGVPQRQLLERRPDLTEIEITCPNTNRMVPYIDLVNEVLEAAVVKTAQGSSDFVVRVESGGNDVTVGTLSAAADGNSAALLVLRELFSANGYVLSELSIVVKSALYRGGNEVWVVEDDGWRFTVAKAAGAGDFVCHAAPQTSATNDALEVFPEHANPIAYATLLEARFPFNLPLDLAREETDLLLSRRNVGRAEILGAFGLATEDEKLDDQNIARAYLGLSEAEHAAITGADTASWVRWGFAADAPQAEVIRRPDKPTLEITGTWIELLGLVPVFLHRSGLSYQELLELLDTEFVHVGAAEHPSAPALPRSLHIAASADALVGCNCNEYQIAHLSRRTLNRINCFVRLWRKLGWTMRELDHYLMTFANGAAINDLDDLAAIDFRELFRVKRLVDELRLKPLEAMALFRDLHRRRTPRNERSLFDEVFLSGAPDQLEYQELKRVARGEFVPLAGAEPRDYPAYVGAALGLDAASTRLVWDAAVSGSTLGTSELSAMYRVSLLSRALGLTVAELFDAFELFGRSPFPSPTDAHAVRRELGRLRDSGLSVADVAYLLRHDLGDTTTAQPTQADLQGAIRSIAAAAAEISAANPAPGVLDAVTLGTAVGKVVAAERVVGVVAAVENWTGSAEQQALLTRYCASFLAATTAELNTFYAALSATARPADRLELLWAAVQDHLVTRAREIAAVKLCAELSGLASDTVEHLLRRGLSQVAGPGRALLDWTQQLAGGWSDVAGRPRLDPATGGWSVFWAVPADGAYRFIVSVAGSPAAQPGDATLSVDGLSYAAEAVITGSGVDLVFAPVAAKGGTVRSIALTIAAGIASRFELVWRVDDADPVPVLESSTVPFSAAAYLKLRKAALALTGLRVDNTELEYLTVQAEAPDAPALLFDRFPLAETPSGSGNVPWTDFAAVSDLLRLNRTVTLTDTTLFQYWQSSPADTTPAALAALTGWREEDIVSVRDLWPSGAAPAFDDAVLWYVLRAAMHLLGRLDLRAAEARQLLGVSSPTLSTATRLRATLRAQYTRDTWKDAFKPLRDRLRQRQRDALVAYLTSRPVSMTAGGPREFFDANELFSHYLIDVEMEPDTLISRLKLALNAIQLFVQRAFLGLEDDLSLVALEKVKEEWTWMRNYRVWEANRKVFLYPENWLEPELRDDKTDLFRELENELLEDQMSEDRAVRAVGNYLEKLNEISSLEVTGAYIEPINTPALHYNLHVVGRTRSQPRTHYYRVFAAKQAYDGRWTPWRKIDVDITGEVVAPAMFNGRLHLFWLMARQENSARALGTGTPATEANAGEERAEYRTRLALAWTEYSPGDDKWLKPRLSKSSILDETGSPLAQGASQHGVTTDGYHLRVEEVGPETMAVVVLKTAYPLVGGSHQLAQLSKFVVRANGHDSTEDSDAVRALGPTYPIGTILRHNAAVEHTAQVENELSNDTLAFKGSAYFLARTPSTYRILPANFGFLDPPEYPPFFYETDTKSLFAFNRGIVVEGGLSQETVQQAQLVTFNHPLARELQIRFQGSGPAGIMNRLTEALPVSENYYYNYTNSGANYYYSYYGYLYLGYHIAGDGLAWWNTQRKFEIEYRPHARALARPYALPTIEFGYGTPFGIYNWELFFHVPMLIAARFGQELKFEDAMRWYHFVFDPKENLNKYERTKKFVDQLPPGARYWNFLPFFANKEATRSLLDALGLTTPLSTWERAELAAVIDEWRRDAFNPHLIARQRIAAYQKAVVMKYLDNLIAWADDLFRADTFESINQATQLYVLAAELLGRRPEAVEPLGREPRYTYQELRALGLDDLSNAVVELEYLVVGNSPHLKEVAASDDAVATQMARNVSLKTFYFQVPRNEYLDAYWSTVEDRLFKIRNSMNIDGIKRQLALFEPPIDPGLLVRAKALGQSLADILKELQQPLPHYRFRTWIQKAIELCNEVKGFGQTLLGTLEKADAEALGRLRQEQEVRMLGLVRQVREQQIDEAQKNRDALDQSKAIAQERHDNYVSRDRLSRKEHAQLNYGDVASVLDITQGALQVVAGALSNVPEPHIGAVGPFPVVYAKVTGGSMLGASFGHAATAVGVAATAARALGAHAGIVAGHDRRAEDWDLAAAQALAEVNLYDKQILAADVRKEIAARELENHDRQLEHAEEVLEFLRSKFTNKELYRLLATELTRAYRAAYELAYQTAKTAEKCFQFELGTTTELIGRGHMDVLPEGLLAGEKLGQDLRRLELAYLERDQREFELTKAVSLALVDGEALESLRETGACDFAVPEVLFDLDFPGQYFRRIKSVRVTIPCVTGPHTGVTAKLTLLGSAVRKETTLVGTGQYAATGPSDTRFAYNLTAPQSIATSTAQSDAGLFNLDFRDERYLPFEGAGAISTWRLELPQARQFDYRTISDVVLHMSYTARDSGGRLAEQASDELAALLDALLKDASGAPEGLVRVISLKQEFPDVLARLLATENQEVELTLLPHHFPYVLRDRNYVMTLRGDGSINDGITAHVLFKPGSYPTDPGPFEPALGLNVGTGSPVAASPPANDVAVVQLRKGSAALLPGWSAESWTLKQADLSPANVDDITLFVRFRVAEPS